MKCYVGLDVGSISADIAVMGEGRQVLETRYVRVLGRPLAVAYELLAEALESYDDVQAVALTGSGAKEIARLLGVPFVNEIIAQARATALLAPEARTVIDVGGAESKLVLLGEDPDGRLRVADFAMNGMCAAGTGSFLDQQASRLRVSIEEFAEMALRCDNPPPVAGRCSVFAKSDMIHLQQQGTPDYAIVAGLCYAMARNFKSSVGAGKEFARPVSFQGGVSANAGMVKAFRDVLGLADGELIVPPHANCTGAIGAVLHVLDSGRDATTVPDLEPLRLYLEKPHTEAERMPALRGDGYEVDITAQPLPEGAGRIDAYVGVDVGSISTNVVVLDSDHNVIARRYLMTEGRPLEAVKKGLYEVGCEIGDRVTVRGCATTGSGRYLTGEFIGADAVRNEITTHARGAVEADPNVDTIFEIGGQDAKYMSLDGGAVVDFTMNKVCAAGTGSFLEEQAERLDLKIEKEFGKAALSSDAPCRLGERCTVFMESDLTYRQQRGVPRDDLVAGLSYSIVTNYLNRVVEDHHVGDVIFFQGGVAFNRGVKAAFEAVLGKKVIVPPHQDIMGAIGAAIIAHETAGEESRFRGFDLRDVGYELDTFECKACSNRCEIHRVSIQGRKPLHFGSRCGRFDDEKKHSKAEGLPDLFAEREAALLDAGVEDEPIDPIGVNVGIPRVMSFFELYPLWKAFFTELGCRITLSGPTNRETVRGGAEASATEACLPIIAAHGHVQELLKSDVDYVFVPCVVSLEHEAKDTAHSYACPLSQGLPYLIRAALDPGADGPVLLDPVFEFERGRREAGKQMMELAERLGVDPARAKRAVHRGWAALDAFRERLVERGREVLERLPDDRHAVVVVSRAYNGCDAGLNLGIPDKMRDLGVVSIPLDMLDLDVRRAGAEHPRMYWKYGQRILAAARVIGERANLHAVYITNFRCGPDAFITRLFGRDLGKPYLTIEIDQHSSDVGAVTRCEAFVDSFRSSKVSRSVRAEHGELTGRFRRCGDDRKIYIPYMDDHSRLMAPAMRAWGFDGEALPMADQRSVELGRRVTTGKECYPCILTTGDILKKTHQDDFDPERAAFFMPGANGPCRFGQYCALHRMVLDDEGHADVPMVILDQGRSLSAQLRGIGAGFYRTCWRAVLIVDSLQKMVREIRPYERETGETDRVYEEGLEVLARAAERREDLLEVAAGLRANLEAVPVDRSERRPLIGIVGEIYVRSNQFANGFLVRKLEAAGAQVMMPTFQEWLDYVASERREASRRGLHPLAMIREWLSDRVARHDEEEVAQVFDGAIELMAREAPSKVVIELGSRYLDPAIKGEAVLSMGRALEYAHNDFDGIVNVAPFGCMPGTLVSGLLAAFRREHPHLPLLDLSFDGTSRTADETLLDAFVHQTRDHMEAARPEPVRVGAV